MNQLPENSLRRYDVTLVTSYLIGLSRALTLDKKLKLFTQLQQFCSTYSTQ